MKLDREGRGTGELAIAAKITGDEEDRMVEIENFTIQPVRLENVRVEKR